MKICTLASSSKGNSTIIFTDNTRILIDAGISYSEMQDKLKRLGFSCADMTAVIVTHEHSDHIKGIKSIIRKNGVPVYIHTSGYDALISKIGKNPNDNIIQFFDQDFTVGDFTITPFRLSHDVTCCLGYSVSDGKNKMTIATDLGVFPSELIQYFENSKLVILESNHDIDMLLANPRYSFLLKNRILGRRGHLDNNMASRVVEKLAHMGVQQVILAHLSEENNTPEVCFNTTCTYLASVGIEIGKHINVDIAPPHEMGVLYNLK